MRNWRHSAIEIISFLLIVLFVYTATSKLFNLTSFTYTLQKSPLLEPFARLIAWAIPLAELVISILLIVPSFRRLGLLFSFALLLVFTAYIGWMLLSTSNLPCSCGGVIGSMGWKMHFLFNCAFTGLALAGWVLEKNRHLFYLGRTMQNLT